MLNYIEKKFALGLFEKMPEGEKPYYKGLHITVIGGGIAGTAFARFILEFSKRENIKINITIINNISCNYCAGLMTNIAYDSITKSAGYNIDGLVVLTKLTDCVFINEKGAEEVPLEDSLISVLRTNKFGVQGFDDYIKKEILTGYEEFADNLKIIEPAMVTDLDHIPEERKYNIYYNQKGMPNILKTDVVVFAMGLQKMNSKLIEKLKEKTGYEPPVLMNSSVTEIDLSFAKYNKMQNKVFIINEIIPHTMIGLVSKREDWLTVSSLNKVLTVSDLQKIFTHPAIREYVYLEDVKSALKCGIVCPTNVFVKESKKFYGQGWAAIGDLTGIGRALKDGYFHSVKQAYYAAWTIVYKGALEKSFDKFYYKNLKPQIFDNRVGMTLFRVNDFLRNYKFFTNLFLKALQNEKKLPRAKRYFSSGVRGLITGEYSYKTILFLFAAGIIKQLFRKDTWAGTEDRKQKTEVEK